MFLGEGSALKSTVVRIRVGAAAIMVAALAAVSACASPPTTTYTDASGQAVTVDWKDFPVHAGTLPEDVLAAPVKEDAEAVSEAILTEVKTALDAEFGLEWAASGESGWYPSQGNGYGGKSMTTTWNSVSWSSKTAPAETVDWERTLDIVSGITKAHGLGPVKLSPVADDPQKYGITDPKQLYWWVGTAYADSQWLSLAVVNVDRDSTGEAAKEYASTGLPPRSISIDYGVTTVAQADRAALETALAPFSGLTRPEPTTSD